MDAGFQNRVYSVYRLELARVAGSAVLKPERRIEFNLAYASFCCRVSKLLVDTIRRV